MMQNIARLFRYALRMLQLPVDPPLPPRRRNPGLVAAMALAILGVTGCTESDPLRPDLVLITVDALAADRLACFGGPQPAGRAICDLAQNGTLFAWAVSSARSEASGAATVLTGTPEAVHKVTSDGHRFLADAQTTLAETLHAAGYATAAFILRPELNRSRRLDQGFDLYEDRFASPNGSEGSHSSASLVTRIQEWRGTHPKPRFIWIHADRSAGLEALDRLVAGLSASLSPNEAAPGVLFAALRGEAPADAIPESDDPANDRGRISWRRHRIPMLWRPPATRSARPSGVSNRLATLLDIEATLRAASGYRPRETTRSPDRPHPAGPASVASQSTTPSSTSAAFRVSAAPPAFEQGRDLGALVASELRDAASTEKDEAGLGEINAASDDERWILLESLSEHGEVGLASGRHLYVRRASELDGSGRAVPTTALIAHGARFQTLPLRVGRMGGGAPLASLIPGPWRTDVLAADSPVPRLEFHLAQKLRSATHRSVTHKENR